MSEELYRFSERLRKHCRGKGDYIQEYPSLGRTVG